MRSLNKLTAFVGGSAAMLGGGMAGLEGHADAAIVYSGVVNLNVPNDYYGIYLNVVTGQTSSNHFAGYDFEIYGPPDQGIAFYTGSPDAGTSSQRGFVGVQGHAYSLTAGAAIDGSSPFVTSVNSQTPYFPAGSTSLVGFRFLDEDTGTVDYGWFRVTSPITTGPFTLVDYAYDDSGAGIAAGAGTTSVPEPASLSALALGAVGLAARRRSRSAA